MISVTRYVPTHKPIPNKLFVRDVLSTSFTSRSDAWDHLCERSSLPRREEKIKQLKVWGWAVEKVRITIEKL